MDDLKNHDNLMNFLCYDLNFVPIVHVHVDELFLLHLLMKKNFSFMTTFRITILFASRLWKVIFGLFRLAPRRFRSRRRRGRIRRNWTAGGHWRILCFSWIHRHFPGFFSGLFRRSSSPIIAACGIMRFSYWGRYIEFDFCSILFPTILR